MKELFREISVAKIHSFKTMLESEGILTVVTNNTYGGEPNISFFGSSPVEQMPALSVLSDSDYERAIELIKESLNQQKARSAEEQLCGNCEETNPGHFDICWSCESELK